MVFVETSFPRGGTVIPSLTASASKIVFGARQEKTRTAQPTKKQREIQRKLRNESKDKNIEALSAELLNHKTIQEGMVIMGSVKSIDPTFLKISLPGRIVGKVLATYMSNSYTNILSKYVESEERIKHFKPLNELFHIGQIVYAKITEITNSENGKLDISLSLKPFDVHSNMFHNEVRKGMVFNGAIEEILEHGCIIESGIKDLRCFLPSESMFTEFSIGELVLLKIEKLTQTNAASTAVCKRISADKQKKIKDLSDGKLDYILPSTVVKFTVTKILKDGLQGTLMNGTFTGYVNEHHLPGSLSVPDDIEVNTTFKARLLYVMPLTKLVYLSLKNFNNEAEDILYEKGQIIEDAEVYYIGTGGVVLNLGNQCKGLISFKSIKVNYIGNYDQDEMLAKYRKNSKIKVRIVEFDLIDSLYICTDNPTVLNQKIYSLSDVEPGHFVTGDVLQKNEKGIYFLSVGNLKGLIEPIFLSSATMNLLEKTKVRCRILGANPERNILYLTNRKEYMIKEAKILKKISNAKENKIFLGTIVKCYQRFFIIKFFNNIKGILYKNEIKDFMQNDVEFSEGQTMYFRIISRVDEKIVLGLPDDIRKSGDICKAKVTKVMENGLEVVIDEENQLKGLIPVRFLSDFCDLVTLRLKSHNVDDTIEVVRINRNIYSTRDVQYFKNEPIKDWKSIKNGDILRAFIKNVENGIIEIVLPLQNDEKIVKIHWKMFITKCVAYTNISVASDQIIYVKIISKDKLSKTFTVSAKLTDVWNGNLKSTGSWFANYLDEIKEIRKSFKNNQNTLGIYKIGDTITGEVIDYSSETKDCYVELSNNIQGIIKSSIVRKQTLSKGKNINCVILWIDYLNEIVYLSHKSQDIDRISKDSKLPEQFIGKIGVNAKVLLILNELIICSIKKGKHPLVFVPTRLHYNDFENTVAQNICEGGFCRLAFVHDEKPIAIFEDIWKLWRKLHKSKKSTEEMDSDPPSKRLKLTTNGVKSVNINTVVANKKRNLQVIKTEISKKKIGDILQNHEDGSSNEELDSENENENAKTTESNTKPKPVLPGTKGFWSINLESLATNQEESQSSDEDDDEKNDDKQKRKLTTAERYKAEKNEEARLREIEEQYANPHLQTQTADQFDRLVLANPNNSLTWINYMVFHLEATEIDKARTIAQNALKTISFREENELINIWVALLNLELLYGTKESYNDVLKEALLCNDQHKIYIRCLQILSDAKKLPEINEIINIITKKFKEKLDIWKSAALAYFEVGLPEKAKQLLHKALAVLPERDHIHTIVCFANLNYKYDDKETAHALLEQIVTSYPKRVDVWSQYVDMLIKDQQIDSARQTLERAIAQKNPIKKMRTLFKKYLEFEELHGNEESVNKVKEMAESYVQNEINS